MTRQNELYDLEKDSFIGGVERPDVNSGIPSMQALDEDGFNALNNPNLFGDIHDIFVTNECPVMCAHCVAHSGAGLRGGMTCEQIEPIIRQIAQNPSSIWIELCGGEPFENYEVLKHGCKITKDAGLKTMIMTSCNWATSPAEVERLLAPIAGCVDRFHLSMDPYHQRVIPLENIHNAIQSIEKYGIDILILSTINKDDVAAGRNISDYVKEISEQYNIAYQVWPLRDFGRGKNIPHHIPQQRADQGCGLTTFLTFYPEGDVHACPGGAALFEKDHPMHLGFTPQASADDMINNASCNPLIHALRSIGPVRLLDLLDESQQEWLTQCTACHHLTNLPDVKNRVIKALAKRPDYIDYITRYRKKAGDKFPEQHLETINELTEKRNAT